MTKKLKIFHAQGWGNYSNWIPNKQIVSKIEDADLLFIEGGSDLQASMYGEEQNKRTSPHPARDEHEAKLFYKAQQLGIYTWGTCRGIQLIAAMNGAKLIQHQPSQGYIHGMKTYDGKELLMSSMHHQAVNPYVLPKEDYKILSWTEGLSEFHWGAKDEEVYTKGEREVEACYFPKTRSVGVQGHPEALYGDPRYIPTINWCRDILYKMLDNKL